MNEVRDLLLERGDLQILLTNAKFYKAEIQKVRDRIAEQYGNAKRRIDLLEEAKLGVDDETGMLLRQQRSRLPRVNEVSRELRTNLKRAAKAQIALIKIADRISLSPLFSDEEIGEFVKKHSKVSRERVNELLRLRGDTLKKLSEDNRDLNKELTQGTDSAKLTIVEIGEYSNYIDERLLWIKSTKALHWSELAEEWARVMGLF